MNRERHPLNVEGPFYVENGECMSCGAPEMEAGGLMSHDEGGHCFFVRQPASDDEVDSAIRATLASCCGAIRYRGDDSKISIRLAEIGETHLCDNRIPDVEPIRRNQARFEWCDPKLGGMGSTSRSVIGYIAASMSHRTDCEVDAFQEDAEQSSFRYSWAKSLNDGKKYCIRIGVRHEHNNFWLLTLAENEQAETGTAMMIDRMLQQNGSVRSVRWFSRDELAGQGETGRSHPY